MQRNAALSWEQNYYVLACETVFRRVERVSLQHFYQKKKHDWDVCTVPTMSQTQICFPFFFIFLMLSRFQTIMFLQLYRRKKRFSTSQVPSFFQPLVLQHFVWLETHDSRICYQLRKGHKRSQNWKQSWFLYYWFCSQQMQEFRSLVGYEKSCIISSPSRKSRISMDSICYYQFSCAVKHKFLWNDVRPLCTSYSSITTFLLCRDH